MPLTEEMRLKIFGSPDSTVSLYNQLSDWDSRLPSRKFVSNFEESPENLFESYGDFCENLFDILAVVIILIPISSVRGHTHTYPSVDTHIHIYI